MAKELWLVWALPSLRQYARASVSEALEKYDGRMGLPPERQAYRHIYLATKAAGQRIRAEKQEAGHRKQSPTEESVNDALGAFSPEEWESFIAEFGEEDLAPLHWTILDSRRNELEQSLGRKKYSAIYAAAAERGIVLSLERAVRQGAQFINISIPIWAAYLEEWWRRQNLQGHPSPSENRSAAEMGHPPAIAEALSQDGESVSPYKVREMLKRVKQEPFRAFDGTFQDWMYKMTDPSGYERYRRSLERGEQ